MKTNPLRFLVSALIAFAGCQSRAADVSITGLPAISSVQSATVLPVVDVSGTPTTKKATVTQLITGLPAATGSTDGKMIAADKAKLDAATNANTASAIVRRDASGNFAANVITAASVTGLSDPVLGSDAATKNYVDASAAGLIIKTPARAATTGSNITLAGGAPTTLDGVSLNTNDRVLVKDQTDGKENGIYYVATLGSGSNGTWTRTTDADTGAELVTGSYVFITAGTTNVQSAWTMVTPGTIIIGTSTITWNLFSQTTQILASNIIGQIVGSQIQNSAINTAKFAAGLTPVEIVTSLPTTGNFTGRTVFYTVDSKLYRYNGSAFTAAVPTVDLTGQVTTTQISDNAISTPKLQAGSVTATTIATNAITAGKIDANAVTAGTISAGAVNTAELAAGAITTAKIFAGAVDTNALAANAVTAGKILAGTITADKLTISSLSAITANIGTITSGTLSSSISITVGSGTAATSISSSGLSIASGRISLAGDGTNPYIRMYGTSSYASDYLEINGLNGVSGPILQAVSGAASVTISTQGGLTIGNNKTILLTSGTEIHGQGSIHLNSVDSDALSLEVGQYGSAGSQDGYIGVIINGVAKKIPFYSF